MPDNTAPERVYLRVCRNPHEPFFWDADTPDEGCPGEGCEDDPHDTYINRDALLRWLDEQIGSEKEWGGIAGSACADAYEHVKAHIEGRDTDE